MSHIYHLEIEAKFCNILGLVNKFPIYSLKGEKPAIFSKPINSALIGKKNLVELIVTPTNPWDPERRLFSVKGFVKKYNKEEFVGPEEGEIIVNFSHEQLPFISFNFDNDQFNYSKLLLEGPQIIEREVILKYAKNLIAILSSGNVNRILLEFKPKLDDYAIAYEMEPESMYNLFTSYLTENYFKNSPRLNISDSELNLISWCGDRIWEIGVGLKMEELLLTEQDKDGLEYATKVYVGLVKNEIKVVR